MKLLILSVSIIFSATFFNTQAQAKQSKTKQALAFCWQNKKGAWWCDGPTQVLWSAKTSLKKAVKSVGCKDYNKQTLWAGNNRVGHLFFCSKKLADYDRDIRKKYGIKKF